MARIRTLKPELWQDEAFGVLSHEAQLVFIGLITQADDEGRLTGNPARLRAMLFPYRAEMPAEHVDGLLDELDDAGLIVRYDDEEGRKYVFLRSWTIHQRISHPKPSPLPPPPQRRKKCSVAAPSGTIRNPPSSSRSFRPDREEEEEKENSTGDEQVVAGRVGKLLDPVTRVFEAWVEAAGKRRASTKLTPKRRRKIQAGLRDYPIDDLLDAVRGWRHSPHHCGHNETGTVYNDLSTILRDGEQIEKFRDLERGQRKPIDPAGPSARDSGDALAASINGTTAARRDVPPVQATNGDRNGHAVARRLAMDVPPLDYLADFEPSPDELEAA